MYIYMYIYIQVMHSCRNPLMPHEKKKLIWKLFPYHPVENTKIWEDIKSYLHVPPVCIGGTLI